MALHIAERLGEVLRSTATGITPCGILVVTECVRVGMIRRAWGCYEPTAGERHHSDLAARLIAR